MSSRSHTGSTWICNCYLISENFEISEKEGGKKTGLLKSLISGETRRWLATSNMSSYYTITLILCQKMKTTCCRSFQYLSIFFGWSLLEWPSTGWMLTVPVTVAGNFPGTSSTHRCSHISSALINNLCLDLIPVCTVIYFLAEETTTFGFGGGWGWKIWRHSIRSPS